LSNLAEIQPQAAIDAEALLVQMIEYQELYGWHVKPNTKSYQLILTAYANTGSPDSGQRAVGVLRRMRQVHEAEKQAYLEEYGTAYSVEDPESNRRQIVTPDAAIYTVAMRALMQSTPEQAMDLLQEAQSAEGVQLDDRLFTIAIKSLSSVIEKERYAPRRIEAAKQAESILKLMEEYAESKQLAANTDGDDESNPLLVGYNACLDAWSRAYCKEAALHCESILWKMAKDDSFPVKPNTISFNSCQHGKLFACVQYSC
jgi:hypothetical protein